jgi:hypothetical protein
VSNLADPALVLLALMLAALGAVPAAMALLAGTLPRGSDPGRRRLLDLAPIGAAEAARRAEAAGIGPVAEIRWSEGAWLVRAEERRGQPSLAAVDPWSGFVDTAVAASGSRSGSAG